MNDFEEFLNSLPPPPSGPAPKPPRRVSIILSSPNQANPSAATDDRPPMMKKLSRVLNTRRFSKEKKELECGASEADSSLGYHLDAFHGKIGVIQKAISRDKYVVNQYFNYSTSPLLTEAEISNSHYIPPPPLPKLIKLTLKKTNDFRSEVVIDVFFCRFNLAALCMCWGSVWSSEVAFR